MHAPELPERSAMTSQFGKIGSGLHWISALLIIAVLGSGFRVGFATDT